MDVVTFLREHPLLASADDEALRALAERAEACELSDGEAVVRFGEPGRHLGILIEGTLEVSKEGRDGGRERLAVLEPGDYFGEMSLISGEPTTADVRAVGPVRCVLIPHEAFSALVVSNPRVVSEIAKTITARLVRRQSDLEEAHRVAEPRTTVEDPYGLSGPRSGRRERVLVVSSRPRSLSYSYYDSASPDAQVSGEVSGIEEATARHRHTGAGGASCDEIEGGRTAALETAVAAVPEPAELSAVGHFISVGGPAHGGPMVVTDELVAELEAVPETLREQQGPNLEALRALRALLPEVPHVVVFDTAFHQKMPARAHLYALPYQRYAEQGVRRHGTQGIVHQYLAMAAATHLKQPVKSLKMITCHLGGHSTICAIDHGRSVDVSSGLVPLEGLPTATAAGDINAALILDMMMEGRSAESIEHVLLAQSGMSGLSRAHGDLQEIAAAADQGEDGALLAFEVFCYRARKYIGSYIAALAGLDVLVLAGNVGAAMPDVRARICQGLEAMGVRLNRTRNQAQRGRATEPVLVSDDHSPVTVLTLSGDEHRLIAAQTLQAIGSADVAAAVRRQGRPIPVGISAHHLHLCQEDVDSLFGPGHELTFYAPLSQPGQFACQEQVTLVGPRGEVERVRILGPTRDHTQVEISRTEKFKLGIDAPVRESGDLAGTPGTALIGPAGTVDLDEGVICAHRHVHMSPEDALAFGLRERDEAIVRVAGERPLVFGDVIVRISPDFVLEMHIDTDEANAAQLEQGSTSTFEGVQSRQ